MISGKLLGAVTALLAAAALGPQPVVVSVGEVASAGATLTVSQF